MGNFDNVLNRNFVRSLPNSSSSDLSRTAISALEEIAERLNVLQQLGDRERLDTQRRQIEPALDAQLREIEQGRITYAERRLQNSIPSQCQKWTTSQQQARQQPAAQRPLGPIRAQQLPIPAPEALGQAAQPHSPPASSVSYQGRSAQQLKLRRPQHRRAAGTDVAPECQAVALPVPPATGSRQAAAQLAAEAEDIARITTECAPGIPEREFSPQPLQQPTQEHHSSEPPAEARKLWLGNLPGGVSLECSISPSPVSFAEQVSCRSTAQELSTAETGARQGAGQQRAEPGAGSGAAGGSTAGLSTADPRCSTKPPPLGGRGGSRAGRPRAHGRGRGRGNKSLARPRLQALLKKPRGGRSPWHIWKREAPAV